MEQQGEVPDGITFLPGIFPQKFLQGKAFCDKGKLGVEGAFHGTGIHFCFRRQFRKNDPQFIGGSFFGDGFADGYSGGVRQFIGIPQLELAVITGKNAAPGHPDPQGNDRYFPVPRQQKGKAVFEFGHGSVPCDFPLRKNTDQFSGFQE